MLVTYWSMLLFELICLVYVYKIGDCSSFCVVCRLNEREINVLKTSLVFFGLKDTAKEMYFYLHNSVAGVCAVVDPWEGLIIGTIAGIICQLGPMLMDFCHIDDPVGAVSIHGLGGLWVSRGW